jgi:hypothetical protein
MSRTWLIGLVCVLATACATPDSQNGAQAVAQPTDDSMADVIRANDRFSEPIYVEIWGNATGPTTDALVKRGYLEPAIDRAVLSLTEQGRASGVQEFFFQSDIPVFNVPVGRRELVDVVPLRSGRLRSVREVEFTYRYAPNPLGNDLVTDGSRVGELDAKTLHSGRAILGVMEDEWQVSTLQL